MVRKSWALAAAIACTGSLGCAGLGALGKTASPEGSGDPGRAAGVELILVKGGCFRMGSAPGAAAPEESPAHEVCVGDFHLGKTEVTQGQWKAVMGSNPSSHQACGDGCPVEMVSWNDAQAFVARLNALPGARGRFRLPSEAEWEYAARSGGKEERYAGGVDLDAVACHVWNVTGPCPVGQKAPNGLGLHDMTGNVWEWTADRFGATYYAASPRDRPAGPASGDHRVLRGGSFGTEAYDSRTTYRNHLPPDSRGASKGLRLAWSASAPPAPPALAAEPAAPPPPVAPAALIQEPSTGTELVRVPGGCFQMGDAYNHGAVTGEDETLDERPVHEVCLGDFYLGTHEVTQGQWRAVMGTNPSSPAVCTASDCPVDNVTWDEIQAFVGKLNARAGGPRYRLPTEAEWEYSARSGGQVERYAGGSDVESVSWYVTTSGLMTDPNPAIVRPGGARAANGLGLYDMSGNVYEFTSDWYDPGYYARSPRDNPKGPGTGADHVVRGGCASGGPANSRTTRRQSQGDYASGTTGFRLARDP